MKKFVALFINTCYNNKVKKKILGGKQKKVKEKFDKEKYTLLKQCEKEIVCDKCNEIFSINTVELQNANVKNENAERMEVIYFTCPACNEVYVVSIHDMKAKVLYRQYHNALEKIQKLNALGQRASSKTIKELDELKNNYLAYQFRLKNKYAKHLYLKQGSEPLA